MLGVEEVTMDSTGEVTAKVVMRATSGEEMTEDVEARLLMALLCWRSG